jgi:hypothetical protein
MNDSRTNEQSIGRRLWNLITDGWVANVPEETACCEFDCQELRCVQGQWETCERRLHHMAVAEKYRTNDAMRKS